MYALKPTSDAFLKAGSEADAFGGCRTAGSVVGTGGKLRIDPAGGKLRIEPARLCIDSCFVSFGAFFFLCDILVNLRTGYVREGRLELGDAKAARNYLKGSFTFDLCILVRHRTHGITRCPTCPPPLR